MHVQFNPLVSKVSLFVGGYREALTFIARKDNVRQKNFQEEKKKRPQLVTLSRGQRLYVLIKSDNDATSKPGLHREGDLVVRHHVPDAHACAGKSGILSRTVSQRESPCPSRSGQFVSKMIGLSRIGRNKSWSGSFFFCAEGREKKTSRPGRSSQPSFQGSTIVHHVKKMILSDTKGTLLCQGISALFSFANHTNVH